MAPPPAGPARPRPAPERFLARVVDAALEQGWRKAEDFLAAFPPGALLEALEDAPEVRARLLTEAAGIPARIAARRSALAAVEDLQIALEEGIVEPARVVALFPSALRVAHLDHARLWAFATGGDWLNRASHGPRERAAAEARVRLVVEAARAEGLLGQEDVLEIADRAAVVAALDPAGRGELAALAVASAFERRPVELGAVLRHVDAAALLASTPPATVWAEVITARVVPRLGLGDAAPAPRSERPIPPPAPPPSAPVRRPVVEPPRPAAPVVSEPPRPALPAVAEPPRPKPAPGIPRPRTVPPPPPAPPPAEEILDIDLEELEATNPGRKGLAQRPTDPPLNQETTRRRALEDRLRSMGRLPPRSEYLSLHILRSITSMYDELPRHRGKTARAQAVYDCFTSEAHLRTGLTALLELLAPGRIEEVSDGPAHALIDAVLTEEKSLWQQARGKRSAGDTSPGRRAVHVEAHLPPAPLGKRR